MKLCDDYIQFIENHFPDPHNTPETFGDYLLPKIQHHDTLCSAVIAEVKKSILPPLLKKYHYRFFCKIDADNQTKQPHSIIDKLIRSSKSGADKKSSESYTLDNFTTTMKDLARFRIVCNFLHDVDEVVEALKNSDILKEMLDIEIKTTMDLHPGSRKSGDRSVKFILEYKKRPGLFLEIQVMTQLCESWDKKDHFLVYEVRRRFPDKEDENFPDYLDAKMHAMAELLYVADNYFEALRAPRRFGKTSLLNHIAKNPLKGWQVCFVDLEGGDSAEKFVEKILGAMLVKECFDPYLPIHLAGQHIYAKTNSEQLAILRKERQIIQKDWKKYAETLFNQVENSLVDTHFLFILDEVSFLIEDMMDQKNNAEGQINELMTWFYEVRKRYSKIRFILSGSEHLPSFLSTFGIDSQLDDMEKAHLDLFDRETAREFIFLALAGRKVVAAIHEIDLMLTLMGKPIPYFLHLFLDVLCRTCKENKTLLPKEIVSSYSRHLLGSESKRYFESILRQLDRYQRYGRRNTAGAKSILDRLAIDENPVAAEELKIVWRETTGSFEQFEIMLEIMGDDFYLVKDENQDVLIDSKLIKEWWLKYGIAGSR